jgi:hypothetical protein
VCIKETGELLCQGRGIAGSYSSLPMNKEANDYITLYNGHVKVIPSHGLLHALGVWYRISVGNDFYWMSMGLYLPFTYALRTGMLNLVALSITYLYIIFIFR